MAEAAHVAVIGAGVSGLMAAYRLCQSGCEVTVFEERDQIGGLARSMMQNGHALERYYHFICGGDEHLKALTEELGIGDKLRWQPGHTSYYVDGRLYPFTTPLDIISFSPVSLLSRLRFGLQGMRARAATDWRQIEHQTAEQWLVTGIGWEAYETIWLPLLKMKFGENAGEVSAPWIWHRIHRVLTSRKSIFRPDDLGYLEGGSETLLSALMDSVTRAGVRLRLGTPVREIVERDGRAAGVITDDGEVQSDAVLSTVPVPVLSMILPDSASEYAAALGQIPFLGVICVLARLREPVTPNFWVNVNDSRAHISGFVEYTNLNPRPELDGEQLLYVPIYLPMTDHRFALSDQQLADLVLDDLGTLFPQFDRSQVVDAVVTRDAYAQAFCGTEFSHRMPDSASPLPGLFVTDSTQLYPADRNISGMIELADKAAGLAVQYVS